VGQPEPVGEYRRRSLAPYLRRREPVIVGLREDGLCRVRWRGRGGCPRRCLRRSRVLLQPVARRTGRCGDRWPRCSARIAVASCGRPNTTKSWRHRSALRLEALAVRPAACPFLTWSGLPRWSAHESSNSSVVRRAVGSCVSSDWRYSIQPRMNCGQAGTSGSGSVDSGRSPQSRGWCQQRSWPALSRCRRIPSRRRRTSSIKSWWESASSSSSVATIRKVYADPRSADVPPAHARTSAPNSGWRRSTPAHRSARRSWAAGPSSWVVRSSPHRWPGPPPFWSVLAA